MFGISHIKLRGFKSFKSVDIVFPDNFVCLAGPNGSGKSNFCDAIRFVMGETSLKSMRAKKVLDLIFSNAAAAEVTIKFDGDVKYEIKRAIRKDGKILYRMNGKRTTRTSIMEALKPYNLDESGRNIIPQGRVQHIVEMGGKERRQIIESVAGISDYEKKKNESLKELESVNVKIRESNIVLGERATYLGELKKEKEIAIKYKDSKGKLKDAKGTLLTLEVNRLEKDLEHVLGNNSKLRSKIKEKEYELEESDNKIKEIEELRSKTSEELQQKQKTSNLIREIEHLKASSESKKLILNDKETQLTTIEDDYKFLIKEIENDKKEISIVQKEIDGYNNELKKFSSEDIEVKMDAKILGIQAKLEEHESNLQTLKNKFNSLTSEIATKNEILKLKSEQIDSLKEEIEREGKDDFEDDEIIQNDIHSISSELDRMFDKEKDLNNEIAELDKNFLHIREKAAQLKAQASPGSFSPAISYIKEMKDKKEIKGIYGIVADLIQFEPKYTNAVEAATGGRLLYVIVDSAGTATNAINHLKKMGRGRATFIPLDKITSFGSKVKNSLIDNITFDAKLFKAMDFIFSSTALVNTMADAKSQGIGKDRMVTLDGELFERSGLISGGKLKGGLLTSSQLKKIEQEIDSIRSQRNILFEELRELREKGNQKRREKSELEVKLKTIEIEKQNLKEKIDKIKHTKEKITNMESEMKSIDSEIKKITKDKSDSEADISSLEVKISKLKEDFKKEDDQRIRNYDELSKKKTEVTSKISSLKATIEGKQKELTLRKTELFNKEEDSKSLTSNKKEFLKNISLIKKELTTLAEDLIVKEEKIKKYSKQIESLFAYLKENEEKLRVLGEERGKIKLETDRFEKEINQNEIKKATVQTRLIDLKAELEQYREINMLEINKDELLKIIKESESLLEEIGSVNMAAIELYDKKNEEIINLKGKISKLADERQAILSMIDEIDYKKKQVFFDTFNAINDNFQKMFDHISVGKGYLQLDKPNDPFESNMRIRIKKGVKDVPIESLSGGESALVALAFIFAMQFFKPSPYYILDEVDAALDKENSKQLVRLIKEMSKTTQFILVSHNDNVIEEADSVLGVTKVGEVSKIVGVQLEARAK